MFDWESWVQVVWDVLQSDDEACWGLIRSAGGQASATIALAEGDASAPDALAYARTLSELGFVSEARDVLVEVLRVVFGVFRSPVSA